MLLKSCSRCGVFIPYGSAYCKTCTPLVEQQREEHKQNSKKQSNRKYNAKRDPKYSRFYSSTEWKMLSAKVMQDKQYKCQQCGAKLGQFVDGVPTSLEVHHIQPIQSKGGWDLRLDYNNLILLCLRCHNDQHGRFKKK